MYAQGILCIRFMLWTSFVTGGIAVAAPCLLLRIITIAAKKSSAASPEIRGYFVTFCEGCVVVAAAIANI